MRNSNIPNLILGYHGCDIEIKRKILNGKSSLRKSENKYDWLGHGMYFWENDPDRALEWAKFIKDNPRKGKDKINNPSVIGAVIDLGYCLNLVESSSLYILKGGYKIVVDTFNKQNLPIPENSDVGSNKDLMNRELDCAVIQAIHNYNKETGLDEYDSVRGVFWEGEESYPTAGFREKNHIQICIRNSDCIKGFFHPLSDLDGYSRL